MKGVISTPLAWGVGTKQLGMGKVRVRVRVRVYDILQIYDIFQICNFLKKMAHNKHAQAY